MINKAKELILNEDIVAIPTETVYGLAGSIYSAVAVEKIFKTKERPFFDPLIVHVTGVEMAKPLTTNWNQTCDELAKAFWPGPLTLVLPKDESVSDMITSGLPSVGIRCPNHPIALEIIKSTNTPLAAPSANKFTKTSPTSKEHVYAEFGDDIYIIDGGQCDIGIESTVIGVFDNEIKIYRPGMINSCEIKEAITDKNIKVSYQESPVSPGALKHHYMPKKKVTLLKEASNLPNVSTWIVPKSPQIAARELYSRLRMMDEENTEEIHIVLDENFKSQETFKGILNRLDKAKTFDHYFV